MTNRRDRETIGAMRYALLFALLTACGDDSPAIPDAPMAECATSTKLNGATVTCSAGYCVGNGPDYTQGPIVCKPKCADVGACPTGQHFMTIQVSDGPPICYCEGQ